MHLLLHLFLQGGQGEFPWHSLLQTWLQSKALSQRFLQEWSPLHFAQLQIEEKYAYQETPMMTHWQLYK
jgi:hypothetical protein